MEMKNGKLKIALFWLMLLLVMGCNQKQDKVTVKSPDLDDKDQVEQAIRNVFAWAENKDFDLFYSTLANDSDFISVTPYERVKFGFSAVREDSAFWADPAFKAVGYDISDLKIRFSGDKTVAWFYCVVNDYNTLNDEPANWLNARWTGVLEKRNGRWVVVQQHFSWAR
jgi:ketosteroid isomerase-like protein